MSDGQKNCLTLIVALVILTVFGIAIVLILQKQKEEKLKTALGEETFNQCATLGGGNANLGNFPTTQGPFKSVVIGLGQNDLHEWHEILPEETKAESRTELSLIFCVGEIEKQVVEECPYYREAGSLIFAVQRFQLYKLVAVFNATTQRRIADVRVMGGPPKACEDYRYDQQGSVTFYNGTEPDENAFLRAIWEYIYRDTSRRQ
jgi:hypothetical protein